MLPVHCIVPCSRTRGTSFAVHQQYSSWKQLWQGQIVRVQHSNSNTHRTRTVRAEYKTGIAQCCAESDNLWRCQRYFKRLHALGRSWSSPCQTSCYVRLRPEVSQSHRPERLKSSSRHVSRSHSRKPACSGARPDDAV